MKKVYKSTLKQSCKPILIHVMICFVSMILSTFNRTTGDVMMASPITSIIYVLETMFLIVFLLT